MIQHFHIALALNHAGSLCVKIVHILNYYLTILFDN